MTALATLDGIARSIKEVVGVQIARQSSLGDPTTSLNGRMKLPVSVDADDHVAVLVRLGLGGEHVGQTGYGEWGPIPTQRLDQRRGRSPAGIVYRRGLPSHRAATNAYPAESWSFNSQRMNG